MTIATPISAGRCRSNRVLASRPPAEPPTHTIGNSLAAFLPFMAIILLRTLPSSMQRARRSGAVLALWNHARRIFWARETCPADLNSGWREWRASGQQVTDDYRLADEGLDHAPNFNPEGRVA